MQIMLKFQLCKEFDSIGVLVVLFLVGETHTGIGGLRGYPPNSIGGGRGYAPVGRSPTPRMLIALGVLGDTPLKWTPSFGYLIPCNFLYKETIRVKDYMYAFIIWVIC